MAFIEFPHEKKQRILIIALTAIVLVSATIVYFGFLRSAPVATINETPIMGATNGQTANGEIGDINFLFLQDQRFLELKKYGDWPIEPRKPGRENPFQPFEGYQANKVQEINVDVVDEDISEATSTEETLDGRTEETAAEETDLGQTNLGQSVEEATIEELLRLLNEDGGETGTTTGE